MDRRKITRSDFIHIIKVILLFFFPRFSPPPHWGGGGSERTAVWCLAACRVKPQHCHFAFGRQTKVSISDKDLEAVIIFLASSKRGDFISNEDLIECQKQWLEMMEGQSREMKTGVQAQFHTTARTTVSCVTSAGGKAKEMKLRAPTKPETQLTLLEVPPADTEPERRYLSYNEMEETGKRFRGRRRWKKNKDSPLEWKEKCRLVRSGDAAVDEHCLPSTAEGDVGALVDWYHRDCFVSYLKSLCGEHNSCLTELMLQKRKAETKGLM
ncbi:EF-hand calcium-binding domain-containing protein 12 [Aptenodytes patagonicus]|uniref:EF-hand calcium-binding domain-containing protein 12 n=1 Tax=Aptenodytes patagonicus TaxID=9234 RepID=UPI003FA09386